MVKITTNSFLLHSYPWRYSPIVRLSLYMACFGHWHNYQIKCKNIFEEFPNRDTLFFSCCHLHSFNCLVKKPKLFCCRMTSHVEKKLRHPGREPTECETCGETSQYHPASSQSGIWAKIQQETQQWPTKLTQTSELLSCPQWLVSWINGVVLTHWILGDLF